MPIEINDPCKSVTSEDIGTFERQYRVTMPSSYRRFVLQKNGGRPVKNTLQFFNEQFEEMETFIIYRFLCIGQEAYSVNNYITTYSNRIPHDLLPIAIGIGRGLICIGHYRENLGKIYYWDPNFESGISNDPTYENVYNISDSLEDMLSKLIYEDEINDTLI